MMSEHQKCQHQLLKLKFPLASAGFGKAGVYIAHAGHVRRKRSLKTLNICEGVRSGSCVIRKVSALFQLYLAVFVGCVVKMIGNRMMKRDNEIWQMARKRLGSGESLMLLVVAESTGSSPGRAGYKMLVAADGELTGSIGGGVMEVNLVEQSRALLSATDAALTRFVPGSVVEQIHQKNSPNPSGMICSGRQTVIFRMLTPDDLSAIENIVALNSTSDTQGLVISRSGFELGHGDQDTGHVSFELLPDDDFLYSETLGLASRLIIIGGGHCALALSEVMSRLDFEISIFDDRPDLNTIEKNRFADSVTIVETYDRIGDLIPDSHDLFVAVMTLGYKSDQAVIRSLFNRDFKYFGVLGSRAKVATMFRELEAEGFDRERLNRIHSPIGVDINSRTPEEIAISIAAEIIAVRNQ